MKEMMNKFRSFIDIDKKKAKKKSSTFKVREVIIIASLTMFASLIMGGLVVFNYTKEDTYKDLELSEAMKEFIDNYNYIIDNYYGEVDEEVLIDGAIKGVVEAIGDPYSGFLDENDPNFNMTLDGTFEGIGIEITNDSDGNIVIKNIFENTPAEKAGLKKGDVVVSVNGVDMLGKVPAELSNYIRSQTGIITMKVKRNDAELIFALSKSTIILPSVSSEILGGQIGYIKVDTFSATTFSQFNKHLNLLEKENIKSLIIDVRDNSGGHLSVVRNMASLFLDRSQIVYQTEDKTGIEKIYSNGDSNTKYKIVFLANKNSASASELLIGALKDNLKAYVIGEKTFGKGTVQELQDLSDGNSYKFTIKKWLTPNGTWVHEKGIAPDKEVILSQEYMLEPIRENDNQLKAAIDYLAK